MRQFEKHSPPLTNLEIWYDVVWLAGKDIPSRKMPISTLTIKASRIVLSNQYSKQHRQGKI
jgi:hypothetical protein